MSEGVENQGEGNGSFEEFIKNDFRHFWVSKKNYSFSTACCGLSLRSHLVFQCLMCDAKIHNYDACKEKDLRICRFRKDIVGDTGIIIINHLREEFLSKPNMIYTGILIVNGWNSSLK
jgi:hypothetical protein